MTKNIVARRVSHHINRRTTQSVFRGFDFTIENGRPPNVLVVINLNEHPSACAQTLFSDIRHKYRDWLSYRRKTGRSRQCTPTYAFSFENADGLIHVNWALYIEPALRDEFAIKLSRWVEKVQECRGPYDINVQGIKPGTEKYIAKYILKGTDPDYIDHFFLRRVHAPQGPIYGPRAGTSRNLGRMARTKAGFTKPRRNLNLTN